MTAKYRKKPAVVEAFLLGEELDFPNWWRKARDRDEIKIHRSKEGHVWYTIKTLEGEMRADLGQHYIIQGVQGEIYPCRKDIFEETYEEVI